MCCSSICSETISYLCLLTRRSLLYRVGFIKVLNIICLHIHRCVFFFLPLHRHLFLNVSLVSITTESKQHTDVNKLFLVILLADRYCYFSSVDRLLRIKQVAQRKTVREGRSRSVKCYTCTLTSGRVAQMSYLFSCQEPALLYGTVSLQNFKVC